MGQMESGHQSFNNNCRTKPQLQSKKFKVKSILAYFVENSESNCESVDPASSSQCFANPNFQALLQIHDSISRASTWLTCDEQGTVNHF